MKTKKESVIEIVKKTIMVVDDDVSVHQLIDDILSKEYNLLFMNNGQEALDYLMNNIGVNLILLDMEMPKMNGRVFVRRIQFYPQNVAIPIMLISATQSRLIINSFLKLGVVDYLIKPFSSENLIIKINTILSGT